jgi:hypothetical protein
MPTLLTNAVSVCERVQQFPYSAATGSLVTET